MVDFVPRIDNAVADPSAAARVTPAIAAVPPVRAIADAVSEAGVGADGSETARRQQMASAADYARVQARIAQILADIGGSTGGVASAASSHAGTQMDAMVRRSTVIIPLPPATTETIELAVKLARDMVREAAMTRGAQANIPMSVVDQLLTRPT